MGNQSTIGSGDGTRPTTDGGVDNIGAGGAFIPGKGDSNAPAPHEKMTEKKKDRAASKRDDSEPLGLHESTQTTPNTEPPSSNPGRSGSNGG